MAIADHASKIKAAVSAIDTALGELEQRLASFKASCQVPAEVWQSLQEKAASGELGADMQAAAGLVAGGGETWDSLFSGQSSNSDLVISHLDAMQAEHGAAARAGVGPNGMPAELYR
ncbi:hypothetical protein [Nocardia higoensis]|uniref:hypothetical protein n=1 Tax=Nocardia higoensis TaxID=228599 RepID=UPI0005934088|nr:hypothetical protein [Nocardia higoensis]